MLLPRSLAESTVNTYELQFRQYDKYAEHLPQEWKWTDEAGAMCVLHCIDDLDPKKNTLKGEIAALAMACERTRAEKWT